MTHDEVVTTILEDAPAVAVVRLTRPEKRNALTSTGIQQLRRAVCDALADRSVRCLIITGEGSHFCSGADMHTFQALRNSAPEDLQRFMDEWSNLLLLMLRAPKPIITYVNGPVSGGGSHLVLCSDIVLASERASFTLTGVDIGSAAILGTVMFPLAVGLRRAMTAGLMPGPIAATVARDMGIWSEVLPEERAFPRVVALAKKVSTRNPQALTITKRMINQMALGLTGVVDLSTTLGMTTIVSSAERWLQERESTDE